MNYGFKEVMTKNKKKPSKDLSYLETDIISLHMRKVLTWLLFIFCHNILEFLKP